LVNLGRKVSQYHDTEKSNPNCSIAIYYDKSVNQFICYDRKVEKNVLQIALSEKYESDQCYDDFSCGLLYNKQVTGKEIKIRRESFQFRAL
jgi:hypothetical protein